MIDIDKIEVLAKAAVGTGLPGDRITFAIHAMDPEGILALIAEVRALRADAERYRWLRDKANFTKGLAPMAFNCEAAERIVWGNALTDEWLDDAIDAARAKEQA